MRCDSKLMAILLMISTPALALDMPARKPGLWELKMDFVGRQMPAQVMKHCIDAATDKAMNSQFGGASQENCSKIETTRAGAATIIDAVCKFGDATSTTHSVITGSFDSAYTVDVTSTREGGPPTPAMAPRGSTHMTIAAKWLGPCEAGQKPGDVIMANGMKMNLMDMQKRVPPQKP
jgi:Protein of unknown function (DUF3617)